MLALIYLALAIALGDLLCGRFYRFISLPHRWAAAILVGILLSTCFTSLAGLAFSHTADPLLRCAFCSWARSMSTRRAGYASPGWRPAISLHISPSLKVSPSVITSRRSTHITLVSPLPSFYS